MLGLFRSTCQATFERRTRSNWAIKRAILEYSWWIIECRPNNNTTGHYRISSSTLFSTFLWNLIHCRWRYFPQMPQPINQINRPSGGHQKSKRRWTPVWLTHFWLYIENTSAPFLGYMFIKLYPLVSDITCILGLFGCKSPASAGKPPHFDSHDLVTIGIPIFSICGCRISWRLTHPDSCLGFVLVTPSCFVSSRNI